MTQREQEAFLRACVAGYLIEERGMNFEAGEVWHLFCEEHGWPCVSILPGEEHCTIVCDLDGVARYHQALGRELPMLPTLTPSEQTKAALWHLIRNNARESYHGSCYTALYGVATFQSVIVARALLTLWEEAKILIDQPGLWQSDIPA